MRNRLLSQLMIVALCLTMLPASALATDLEDGSALISQETGSRSPVPEMPEDVQAPVAQTEGEDGVPSQGAEHKHCICGTGHTEIGDHTASAETTFTSWTDTDKLPTTAGNYYLTGDVMLSSYWNPKDGTVLCLNGFSITRDEKDHGYLGVIYVTGSFTLTDCKGEQGEYGKITHGKDTDGKTYSGIGVCVRGGIFTMYGGNITGNEKGEYGGGVYVGSSGGNSKGTFTMYSGKISGNKPQIFGGGVYVEGSSNFTMYGGEISDNEVNNSGGGVFVQNGGNFTMKNGTISGNKVTYGGLDYGGGGVAVAYGGTFIMEDGTISGNKYAGNQGSYVGGGGVHVQRNTNYKISCTAFTMKGGTISDNEGNNSGGGVYVGENNSFIMEGGTISNNKVINAATTGSSNTGGGGGVFVYGHFIMSGGEITGNNCDSGEYYYGGGIRLQTDDDASITVSGNVKITGNTQGSGSDSTVNNVYLPGKTITIGGELTGGSIGVTTSTVPTEKRSVAIAEAGSSYTITGSDKDKFSSDKGYAVEYDSGKLVLKVNDPSTPPAEGHVHYLCGGDTCNGVGHTENSQTAFETKLWMDNGTLKANDTELTLRTVDGVSGGVYVLAEGNYYLGSKLDLTAPIYITSGTVSLCLNGYSITLTQESEANTYVIADKSSASFALTDCKSSGTITHGGGKYGGGVEMDVGSTFDLYGGEIGGNNSYGRNGGGVNAYGTFNMYGGSITNNSTAPDHHGGGVYVNDGCTFAMYGGEIGGNTVKNGKGGGVYVSGSMNVSGSVRITGNKAAGKDNNVYLPSGKTITVGTSGLSDRDSVGVTTEKEPSDTVPVTIIDQTNGIIGLSTKVFSDDIAYETAVSGNAIVLKVKGGSTPGGKTDPIVTAPTAKSGLTYNGQPQELINAGSTTGGEMHYSLTSGSGYSTELPTATKAGLYTVWYRVVGDAAYNDVAEQSMTVYMEKAKLSGTPAFTKVTAAGKTLKDVTLTKIDNWPDGKFEWGNGVLGEDEDAPLVQGKAYSWLYIAENHYAAGTLVPWAADGGSSGGSTTNTEITRNPDGSVTRTERLPDGTVIQTTTYADGSTVKITTEKNGKTVTQRKSADGTTATVKAGADGQVEIRVEVSEKAAEAARKNGGAVTIPAEVKAEKNSNAATAIQIDLPQSQEKTKIQIPVEIANSGTVAVLVHPDGTEAILKDSIPTEEGVQVALKGSAVIKILDNTKDFADTRGHWSRDEVNFIASREIFNGLSDDLFGVRQPMTRGMVNTVLARLADVDTTPRDGQKYYEIATQWAKANGITDGTDPEGYVTRQQVAVMLYRFSGTPEVNGTLPFKDAHEVSDYAQSALLWATQSGILIGTGDGRIAPKANAQREQVAAMIARYIKTL